MSNFLFNIPPSFCQSDDCFLEIPSSSRVGDSRGDFALPRDRVSLFVARSPVSAIVRSICPHLRSAPSMSAHWTHQRHLWGSQSGRIGRSLVPLCFPKWGSSRSRSNINSLALLGGLRRSRRHVDRVVAVAPRSLIQVSSVNGLSLIAYFPVTCSSCQASRHSAGFRFFSQKIVATSLGGTCSMYAAWTGSLLPCGRKILTASYEYPTARWWSERSTRSSG
jgi:hypothetical protein